MSLLNFLEGSINKVVDKNCNTLCDIFAGTGVVGAHFKQKGYRIIANDIQYYGYVLNRHYIGNSKELTFYKLVDQIPHLKNIQIQDRKSTICEYLSNLKGVKGFIYNNYCLGGTKYQREPRQYFSDDNGSRCDAIRQKIEDWKKDGYVSEDEYFFLLASLIESVDKFANTASVYGAFLKKIKRSAQRSLTIKPADLIIDNLTHRVFNKDANIIINRIKTDILYLDPPYNHRQYATNYHLLETIAKYDNPKIYGKTGLRDYEKQRSLYCSKIQVKKAFEDLIVKAKAKYIFLSYNNEGLMSLNDIKRIMSNRGNYGFFTKSYNRFKADKSENRIFSGSKTIEYLHYVVCRK